MRIMLAMIATLLLAALAVAVDPSRGLTPQDDSLADALPDVKVSYDPLKIRWYRAGPYDSKNFMCDEYPVLCANYLDQIGCVTTSRVVQACASGSDAAINNTLMAFNGLCQCLGDPYDADMSTRIGEQLIDNRIKAEIGWMLEPWAIGPPYSLVASYPAICTLMLSRMGCPQQYKIINGTFPYTCQCQPDLSSAAFDGSTRIAELIADKISEADLMELPVWDDPFTLNTEASLALVVIAGKVGALLATAMYLPPIIGFLLAGLAIQNIVSPGLIKGAGGNGPHPTPFGEMRIFALIIVLMRAGITLKPREIYRKGYMSVALAIAPYFVEFAVELALVKHYFGYSTTDAGLLACILAALSPSLVIPGMIKMVEEKLGFTPRAVLTSAPIEVVLAIILYNIFANFEQTEVNSMYPYVKILSLGANIGLIPVNIIFSAVLGFIGGFTVHKYIEWREGVSNLYIQRVLVSSTPEYLLACITTCYTLYAFCYVMYVQQSSGVLTVFAAMLTISSFTNEAIVSNLKTALAGLWVFVEIFLFTTTGINLAFGYRTSPLQSDRGLSQADIAKLVGVLFIGSLGRAAAIVFINITGFFTLAPHRRSPKYFVLWCIATWMFQIPKATVQATLGGLPLAYHIIPGAVGLTIANFISHATAFSILLMAPIGVFLTAAIGRPIAVYLQQLDRQAGFGDNDHPIGTGAAETELVQPQGSCEGEGIHAKPHMPSRSVLPISVMQANNK